MKEKVYDCPSICPEGLRKKEKILSVAHVRNANLSQVTAVESACTIRYSVVV